MVVWSWELVLAFAASLFLFFTRWDACTRNAKKPQAASGPPNVGSEAILASKIDISSSSTRLEGSKEWQGASHGRTGRVRGRGGRPGTSEDTKCVILAISYNYFENTRNHVF